VLYFCIPFFVGFAVLHNALALDAKTVFRPFIIAAAFRVIGAEIVAPKTFFTFLFFFHGKISEL
jgi:hypothetical protein